MDGTDRNLFDQTVKINIRTYKNIRKKMFKKENYNLTVLDLSKQELRNFNL